MDLGINNIAKTYLLWILFDKLSLQISPFLYFERNLSFGVIIQLQLLIKLKICLKQGFLTFGNLMSIQW